MSEQKGQTPPPTTPQVNDLLANLVQTLQHQTMTLTAMHEQTTKRQPKAIDEIVVKTPYDPEGSLGGVRANRLKWEHFFMNGSRVAEEILFDEEIDLLNKLTKSGNYNKGKWGVRVRKHDRTVDISYPNKSVEQRMDLSRESREGLNVKTGLAGMLKHILMEQESRDDRRRRGLDEFDDED